MPELKTQFKGRRGFDRTGAPKRGLADAIAALRSGKVIVYPTETLYGLGADAESDSALEALFAIKQREPDKPVALIASDAAMAFSIAADVPESVRRLADAFWPGPLTLVLPARAGLARALVGSSGGVGARVSSHPVARALAGALGRPITATSANRSGTQPARSLREARAAFGEKVKVYLEGGVIGRSMPSTVVAFDAAGALRILRHGVITEAQLAAALRAGAGR